MQNFFIVIIGVLAANLPFLNQRLFACIPIAGTFPWAITPKGKKNFWIRLIEISILYVVIRGIAYFWESKLGNVFPQKWQFYAITICLFLVFAFPGFVYQYLLKRR